MSAPLGTTGVISAQNANTGSGTPTPLSFVQLGLSPETGTTGPVSQPLPSEVQSVIVGVSGSPNISGGLIARGTVDGLNWVALGPAPFVNLATGGAQATITAQQTGLFAVNVVGLQALRIDAEGAITTAATVSMNASTAQVAPPAATNTSASTLTVAAATGTPIKASAGFLVKVIVVTSGSAATLIYDNASALSGTVIGAIPANPAVGTVYTFNSQFANGAYAGTTNTSSFTAFYS